MEGVNLHLTGLLVETFTRWLGTLHFRFASSAHSSNDIVRRSRKGGRQKIALFVGFISSLTKDERPHFGNVGDEFCILHSAFSVLDSFEENHKSGSIFCQIEFFTEALENDFSSIGSGSLD